MTTDADDTTMPGERGSTMIGPLEYDLVIAALRDAAIDLDEAYDGICSEDYGSRGRAATRCLEAWKRVRSAIAKVEHSKDKALGIDIAAQARVFDDLSSGYLARAEQAEARVAALTKANDDFAAAISVLPGFTRRDAIENACKAIIANRDLKAKCERLRDALRHVHGILCVLSRMVVLGVQHDYVRAATDHIDAALAGAPAPAPAPRVLSDAAVEMLGRALAGESGRVHLMNGPDLASAARELLPLGIFEVVELGEDTVIPGMRGIRLTDRARGLLPTKEPST